MEARGVRYPTDALCMGVSLVTVLDVRCGMRRTLPLLALALASEVLNELGDA
jgi:hypothetical protein